MIPFTKDNLEVGDTVVTNLDEHCIVTEIKEDCFLTQNKTFTPTLGNVNYIIKNPH